MRGGWCENCGGPRFRSRCIGYCRSSRQANPKRKRLSRVEEARIPTEERLEWRAIFDPGVRTAQWRAFRIVPNSVPEYRCLHDAKAPAHRLCTRAVIL